MSHGPMSDYRDVNRANWDERAPAHASSPDYGVKQFIDDLGFISGVVTFDGPLLGDVRGLKGVTFSATSAPTRSASPVSAPG